MCDDTIGGGLGKCRWLEALWQPDARINALPGGLETLNVSGDSEARLVAADIGTPDRRTTKVRVYKGDQQITEHAVLDAPCGLVSLYTENGEPRSAVLAVAAGSSVYIFKNMRPHFKYCTPHVEAHSKERDIWHRAGLEDEANVLTLADDLTRLLKELGATHVSSRTLKFLSMDVCSRAIFAEEYRRVPLVKSNPLTAVGVIRRDAWDEPACSCLVIGTEAGQIMILDPRAFSPMDKYHANWTPVGFASAGLWTGDGHVVVIGRDGRIGAMRRGGALKLWDRLSMPAVAVASLSADGAAVAVMDGSLIGYSKKGIRLWRVYMSEGILDLAALPVPQSGLSLLAVSTGEQGVRVYDGRHQVDTVNTVEPVAAIKYGRLGQEERAMAMVTVNGGLCVKILKRTAHFGARKDPANGAPAGGCPKFVIPRKSRLFVEQTIRERVEAGKIHSAFQTGFQRMKLAAAKGAVDLRAGQEFSPASNPFSLEANVLGLGPNYLIRLTVTNMSDRIPDAGLFILCRSENASTMPPVLNLPLLPAGTPITLAFRAELKSRLPGTIRAFLCRHRVVEPLTVACVALPAVEDNASG